MQTEDVLKKLRAEGFTVTGVTIGEAIKAGVVERPRLRALQFEYGPKHLEQLRAYLRMLAVKPGSSKVKPATAKKGGRRS